MAFLIVFLGSGTISDIAEPSERGGFLGLFSIGPLVRQLSQRARMLGQLLFF